VRIQYSGWSRRRDEWLALDSSRILLYAASEGEESEASVQTLEAFVDAAVASASRRNSLVPSLDPLDAEGVVLDGDGEYKLSVGARLPAVELGGRRRTGRTCGVPCGFRNRVIGDECVMCLSCGERFHADKMCTGIDESVIQVLLRDVKGAVGYVCVHAEVRIVGRSSQGLVWVVHLNNC
jgi:hypothetical protein